MSISINIDWKAEAICFAKENNSNRECVVQLIELAMQKGALLAFESINNRLKEVSSNLDKKRKESEPHQQIYKPIKLDY